MIRPLRYEIDHYFYQRTDNPVRLHKLRDLYRSQPMLVVGNGPSLNETPLDEFHGIPSIGTNKINLIFSRTLWRPSIILCMNRHVIRQQQKWYSTSNIPVFYSWQSRWFIDDKYSDAAAGYFLNLKSPDFSRDITAGVGISWTVTYAALQFAYFMGGNPVILVGVDHRFSMQGPANKLVTSNGPDRDHFHPDYFAPGDEWNLPDLIASEDAYRRAKLEFNASGRQILNATKDSSLDIFDKITMDEAIEISKGPIVSQYADDR